MCIDAVDVALMSTFWAHALGLTVLVEGGATRLVGPASEQMAWVNAVPEPKMMKDRVHFDVTASDVRALRAAGASLLRGHDDEIDWDVLADPEGNEFRAFAARRMEVVR